MQEMKPLPKGAIVMSKKKFLVGITMMVLGTLSVSGYYQASTEDINRIVDFVMAMDFGN